jgi:hypothetical protein
MTHSRKFESRSTPLSEPLISYFVSVWHRVFKTCHKREHPIIHTSTASKWFKIRNSNMQLAILFHMQKVLVPNFSPKTKSPKAFHGCPQSLQSNARIIPQITIMYAIYNIPYFLLPTDKQNTASTIDCNNGRSSSDRFQIISMPLLFCWQMMHTERLPVSMSTETSELQTNCFKT